MDLAGAENLNTPVPRAGEFASAETAQGWVRNKTLTRSRGVCGEFANVPKMRSRAWKLVRPIFLQKVNNTTNVTHLLTIRGIDT